MQWNGDFLVGGVKITSASAFGHDPATTMCLGPACQCHGIASEATRRWDRHIAGSAADADGSLLKTEVPWPRRLVPKGRMMQVPSWVRRQESCRAAEPCGCTRTAPCQSFCVGLLSTPARCTLRARRLRTPPSLDLHRMFRRAHADGDSVCQVKFSMYLLHDDIDAGFVEAQRMARFFSEELHSIMGRVGTNDTMSALLDKSALCWDWTELAFRRPVTDEVRAFERVSDILRPCMENTQYPFGSEFAGVIHAWPSSATLCAQYLKLAERVRRAMSAGRRHRVAQEAAVKVPDDVAKDAATWVEIAGYEARPLWAWGFTRRVVVGQRLSHCGLSHEAKCKLSSIISSFESGLPACAFSTLFFGVKDLRRPGKPGRRRTTAKMAPPDFAPGDVGVNRDGRLVSILRVRRTVAVGQITACIVRHPWFSIGPCYVSFKAWHAARLAHRCSVSTNPPSRKGLGIIGWVGG